MGDELQVGWSCGSPAKRTEGKIWETWVIWKIYKMGYNKRSRERMKEAGE